MELILLHSSEKGVWNFVFLGIRGHAIDARFLARRSQGFIRGCALGTFILPNMAFGLAPPSSKN